MGREYPAERQSSVPHRRRAWSRSYGQGGSRGPRPQIRRACWYCVPDYQFRQVAVLAKELREGDVTLRGRCIVLVGRPQHYHNVSAAARVERTLPLTSRSSSFLRIAATICFPGWVGIGEVLKDINDLVRTVSYSKAGTITLESRPCRLI